MSRAEHAVVRIVLITTGNIPPVQAAELSSAADLPRESEDP